MGGARSRGHHWNALNDGEGNNISLKLFLTPEKVEKFATRGKEGNPTFLKPLTKEFNSYFYSYIYIARNKEFKICRSIS